MAIINQIKQQFRALYEKKPELLQDMFLLAMTDALSFDAESKAGGMDGAVLKAMGLPENARLNKAAAEVERIRKELVDKTQVLPLGRVHSFCFLTAK